MSSRRGQFGKRKTHAAPKVIASAAHGAKRAKTVSREAARASAAKLRAGDSAEGTVSAHRAGYGFVRVEGLKDGVFLPPGFGNRPTWPIANRLRIVS